MGQETLDKIFHEDHEKVKPEIQEAMAYLLTEIGRGADLYVFRTVAEALLEGLSDVERVMSLAGSVLNIDKKELAKNMHAGRVRTIYEAIVIGIYIGREHSVLDFHEVTVVGR